MTENTHKIHWQIEWKVLNDRIYKPNGAQRANEPDVSKSSIFYMRIALTIETIKCFIVPFRESMGIGADLLSVAVRKILFTLV